jgi:hypothetical protein
MAMVSSVSHGGRGAGDLHGFTNRLGQAVVTTQTGDGWYPRSGRHHVHFHTARDGFPHGFQLQAELDLLSLHVGLEHVDLLLVGALGRVKTLRQGQSLTLQRLDLPLHVYGSMMHGARDTVRVRGIRIWYGLLRFRVRVSGFGFRVSGFGFRICVHDT